MVLVSRLCQALRGPKGIQSFSVACFRAYKQRGQSGRGAPPTCFGWSAVLGAPVPGAASGASPPPAPAGALRQPFLMVSVLCTHAYSLRLMSVHSCQGPPDGLCPLHTRTASRVSILLPGSFHTQWRKFLAILTTPV